jgi:hypothetical protein
MKDILLIILGFVLVFALLVVGANAFNSHTCQLKTADIGYPSRYSFWTECQIQVDGRWIPLDSYYYQERP